MEIVQHILTSNVIVLDRIRKDYGDIPALARDIKKNGLLNPISVVHEASNGHYVLLAGERRLKAVKLLGEQLIAVRVIDKGIRPENFYKYHLRYQMTDQVKNKEYTDAEMVNATTKLKRLSDLKHEKIARLKNNKIKN